MKKTMLAALALFTILAYAAEIPLRNPEFKPANGKIPFWWICSPQGGTCEAVSLPGQKGRFAVKLSSTTGDKYFGIAQYLPYEKVPKPGPGEMLQFKLTFRQKNENVGYGGFANLSVYTPKGYAAGSDTNKLSGTFDWKEVTAIRKFAQFPDDTKTFVLYFYLGKTTGTVYFTDPKLEVEVVKK